MSALHSEIPLDKDEQGRDIVLSAQDVTVAFGSKVVLDKFKHNI
jgi:phospholipid/cholesterol/gamma-HCH transport system ATP-binding protein